MKTELVLFIGLVSSMVAAAPQKGEEISNIRKDSNIEPDGSYQYSYANGIKGEQNILNEVTAEDLNDEIVARGLFSYISPDGTQIIKVNAAYVESDVQLLELHLDTPIPIPPAILKALEFMAQISSKQ